MAGKAKSIYLTIHPKGTFTTVFHKVFFEAKSYNEYVKTEEFKTKLVDVENAVKHLKPEMAIGFIVNKTEQVNLEGGGYGYYYAGAN